MTFFSSKYRCRAIDFSSIVYRTSIKVVARSRRLQVFAAPVLGSRVRVRLRERSVSAFFCFCVVPRRQGPCDGPIPRLRSLLIPDNGSFLSH
jgi:hypothetical protein